MTQRTRTASQRPTLRRTTLRPLTADQLAVVAGGGRSRTGNCPV